MPLDFPFSPFSALICFLYRNSNKVCLPLSPTKITLPPFPPFPPLGPPCATCFSLLKDVIPLPPRPPYTSITTSSINIISRSEEHTSELQSRGHLVCRLLLEKKKN